MDHSVVLPAAVVPAQEELAGHTGDSGPCHWQCATAGSAAWHSVPVGCQWPGLPVATVALCHCATVCQSLPVPLPVPMAELASRRPAPPGWPWQWSLSGGACKHTARSARPLLKNKNKLSMHYTLSEAYSSILPNTIAFTTSVRVLS